MVLEVVLGALRDHGPTCPPHCLFHSWLRVSLPEGLRQGLKKASERAWSVRWQATGMLEVCHLSLLLEQRWVPVSSSSVGRREGQQRHHLS